MRVRHRQGRGDSRGERINMKFYAVRGAITVDGNTVEEITRRSVELIKKMIENNKFDEAVSLVISTTKDITAVYPAKAVRESGLIDVPLFSCTEPDIDGSLPLCIRMLLTVCSSCDTVARHAYLRGAAALRKDLADENI